MSVRAFASGWLARAALLLFWSLVTWGALLLLLTVVDVIAEGLKPALARLLPARGASVWAWLNALSVGLAVSIGLLVGGTLAWTRRRAEALRRLRNGGSRRIPRRPAGRSSSE